MIELAVCIGSSCHLKGSYNVLQEFQQLIEEYSLHGEVGIKAAFCMKQCRNAVSVSMNGDTFSVSPESAREFFKSAVIPAVKGK